MDNPQHQYLKMQIETASQPQLLVMLFDAAVKKLHISKKAISDKDIEKAHTELTKVQKIFTELMVALDVDKGGEVATNLLRIYDYVYHQLVRANIKQDITLIDETLPIAESLRDGWTEAVDKVLSEGFVEKPKAASFDSKALPASLQPAPPSPAQKPDQKPAASSPPLGYSRPAAPAPPTGERPRLNIQG